MRSNIRRQDNSHRVLWYIGNKTSSKHPDWRNTTISLLLDLYEIRRDNPAIFFWIRAVDGLSIYHDQDGVLDFQFSQKHLIVNAPANSNLFKLGDKFFGKEKRHAGSGTRQWKLTNNEDIEKLIGFVQSLPKVEYSTSGASRSIPQRVRELVMERDNGKCTVCSSTQNLHFDHIVPFSKGGSSDTEKNIRLLCAKHNLEQGASMKH